MASNFPKTEIKSKYLEENSKHTLLENLGSSAFNFDIIENEDDYELWLVQCPANIKLEEELHKQSIKLPGKTSINKIETISEVFSSPKQVILSYKADDDEFSTKSLSALGRIIIREKLKIIRDEVDINENNSSCVTFPANLKQRHPLLGADFEDKLKLDKNVVNRLENCNIKVEPLEIKKEVKTENNNDENCIASVEQKTKNKRKRKAIDGENNNQIQAKSKKIKKDIVSTNGDTESSLAWIKNL